MTNQTNLTIKIRRVEEKDPKGKTRRNHEGEPMYETDDSIALYGLLTKYDNRKHKDFYKMGKVWLPLLKKVKEVAIEKREVLELNGDEEMFLRWYLGQFINSEGSTYQIPAFELDTLYYIEAELEEK